MNPSHRIVLNTAATYTRSVIGAALALFSSRWILNALGETDFGLFSVVGAMIIFITFLNTVMAGSAARHFAFAIGQGNVEEVNCWFNAALSIHAVLAVILVLVGWPVGEYVITHFLTIPNGRLNVCIWVFRVSLISAFFSMISVPYIAMFTAKQHIFVLAIWNMVYSIMVFILAWSLFYISNNRLLFYAVGMVTTLTFISVAQIVWARSIFQECKTHFHQWFNKSRVREILSFACWNFIGSFGTILRNQGTAILLNIKFGPKVNAAYGIANQVSSQANQLAVAMLCAFSPEITASEGRGDRERMLGLAQRASKFGTILVLLFAVPLIIEMDFVLKLWLVEPPNHSALFCRLILVTFLLERLTSGYMAAVNAHGRIAAYQATVGVCMLLTLPLAWLFLKLGAPPTSAGLAFIITMIGVSAGRVYWVRKLLRVPVNDWIKKVLLPCMTVGIVAVAGGLVVFGIMTESFVRLLFLSFASVGLALLTTWFWALDGKERMFFKENIRRLINRIHILLHRNN